MSKYVLELFFDSPTERSIHELWTKVDSLPGWSPPNRGEARPHLSVCSCSDVREAEFGLALSSIFADEPRLAVDFASVATFPSAEGVVFLAPVVTAELLDLHVRLVAAMRNCGASIPRLYEPGLWVPHCTIAYGIPFVLISSVIDFAVQGTVPLNGHVEQVALLELSEGNPRIVAQCTLV